MIKKIGFAVFAASMMISSVVLAEPIDTLTTEEGNVSIIGFTTAQDGDGGSCFVALLEYTNKTSESDSPLFNYSITAFQDGIELETGYIYDYSYENYKDAGTKIRPDSTLNFYKIFKLDGNSPVVLEVAPMFNFDDTHIEYTFDLSQEMIPDSAPSEEAKSDAGTSMVAEKIAELEQRIADLEARVTALGG